MDAYERRIPPTRPRPRPARKAGSRGQWNLEPSPELCEFLRRNARRRNLLGIESERVERRTYSSPITGKESVLRAGHHFTYQRAGQTLIRVMLKSPSIPTEAGDTIHTTIANMLDGVEVVTWRDKESGQECKVTGMECLDLVMRSMASDYKEFAKLIEVKDYVMNEFNADKYPQFANGQEPTIDQLCLACKIEARKFIPLFYTAVREYGVKRAKLRIDLAAGEVAAATLDNALNGGVKGFRDRKMLLQAVGVVEASGNGINVNVTQNNLSVAPGEARGLPKWEDVREEAQRQLPAPVVDGEVVEEVVPVPCTILT